MGERRFYAPFEDFLNAYPVILECYDESTGKKSPWKKPTTFDEQQYVFELYKIITSNGGARKLFGNELILDICESLLNEWEETAPPSNSIQQLVALFNKPILRELFSAFDKILTCEYSPQLPDLHHEVDDDEGMSVKVIHLLRNQEPLGATIKTDADGNVFIARIIAGGVADRGGAIQVGDRLLELNGVPVTGMKPAEIVQLLDGKGDCTFKLAAASVQTIVETAEKRYLKALADYSKECDVNNPCPEVALSFKRGEILELLVTHDEWWWQARSLGFGAFAFPNMGGRESDVKVGLIPSELLYSKVIAQRELNEKGRGTLRKAPKVSVEAAEGILYEPILLMHPEVGRIRPIVLIGPPGVGRNEMKRRLIMSDPARFTTTVPHTSRQQRPNEVDGVDYYFEEREVMERWVAEGRFLEYGEYKGNFYGTLVDAVSNAIAKRKIPILNPHPLALRILCTPRFKAFVVFVRPPTLERLKKTRLLRAQEESHANVAPANTLQRGFTVDDFERMLAAADQLHQLYGHCFDQILVNENLDHTVKQLRKTIDQAETSSTWVPATWLN